MTKQLEKKKQQEVKKIKDEANRKMYAMEVMQALAQTATAAINAYSSAAAIPLVGYIIAPIAAAMAVAAGMVRAMQRVVSQSLVPWTRWLEWCTQGNGWLRRNCSLRLWRVR